MEFFKILKIKEFFKICEDYGVPHDPMKYKDEKFYWTYQNGGGWPDDYISPDSMTHWIIEKSQGFTDVGLLRISESVRVYVYPLPSSQASVRSSVVENMTSALTAQKAFLNNFEGIVNCRVNIQEDIKHYQDTLSYASSKVDYSVGENIYMLPSDMNLHIKTETVGCNNKILIFDGKFNLGKNDKVNALEPTKHTFIPKVGHKVIAQSLAQKSTITHEEEKLRQYFSNWSLYNMVYF